MCELSIFSNLGSEVKWRRVFGVWRLLMAIPSVIYSGQNRYSRHAVHRLDRIRHRCVRKNEQLRGPPQLHRPGRRASRVQHARSQQKLGTQLHLHWLGEANKTCSSRSGSCAPLTTSPSPFSADKVAIRRPVSCALVPTLSWPGAQGDNGGNLSSCSLRPRMVPYCFVVEASTYYGMSLITTHLAIGS